MPVQYGSILEEHRAVRERVGLFDLSHMGELYVEGPEAGAALASALVSDPPRLAIGRAHYSMICAPTAGSSTTSSSTGWRRPRFLVVANAGNAAIVSDALAERLKGFKAVLDDRSLATGLPRRPGPPRRRGPRPADGCRPGRPALLRGRRGFGGGRSRPDRADRLHRRGRLRDLRRQRPRPLGCGRSSSMRCGRTTVCRLGWGPATPSGSRPGCRSTATSSIAPRTPTRPVSAGSSSSTSPASSSVVPRSRRSPATDPRGDSSA